jgi:predicted extracellular nuclease
LNGNTKQDDLYTIAFYNLENLFDISDDQKTLDDDFTPDGKKKWNAKRYIRKLKKLSSVISQIGFKESGHLPAIIGLAEVENKKVLEDLLNTKSLQNRGYDIVHFNSSDERGIDVALLYKRSVFEFLNAEPVTLFLTNEEGERDYTRDVLVVKGNLKGEQIHVLVNHWPSRRSGEVETEPKRINAAHLNLQIIANIKKETPNAKIIIMGDYNDNPTSISVKQHLVTNDFYNPYESIYNKGKGTSTYNREWHLFDQIILSRNFLKEANLAFKEAHIFEESFLKEWKGKRKGSPFRTYIGKWHQGGFSDHFPVYIQLK